MWNIKRISLGMKVIRMIIFITVGLGLIFSSVSGTENNPEQVRPSLSRVESQNKMVILQEILKTLREEKKEYYRIRQEWKDEKKDMLNQMKSLDLRIEHDAKELETIKQKNIVLNKEMEKTDESIKCLTEQTPLLKALFLKEVQALTEMIKTSLPWQETERMNRLKVAESKIEESEIKPAESFRKLWDILAEESALTRLCEVGSIKVGSKIDGGEKEVDALRLGRLFVLYQSEDQEQTGILFKDATGNFKETKLKGRFREDLHAGILILSKRKPPALVTLPFPLTIYQKKYSSTEVLIPSRSRGEKQDDQK